MEHIKRDFSLNAYFQPPGLRGWVEAKINFFQTMAMLHIKITFARNYKFDWYSRKFSEV